MAVTCRGCIALGTGCGKCIKCMKELQTINSVSSKKVKTITPQILTSIIRTFGDIKPYETGRDNYFIVYGHKDQKWFKFTVNDGYQSIERIYVDRKTAEKVVDYLNNNGYLI